MLSLFRSESRTRFTFFLRTRYHAPQSPGKSPAVGEATLTTNDELREEAEALAEIVEGASEEAEALKAKRSMLGGAARELVESELASLLELLGRTEGKGGARAPDCSHAPLGPIVRAGDRRGPAPIASSTSLTRRAAPDARGAATLVAGLRDGTPGAAEGLRALFRAEADALRADVAWLSAALEGRVDECLADGKVGRTLAELREEARVLRAAVANAVGGAGRERGGG